MISVDSIANLSEIIKTNLKTLKIDYFFPVQAMVCQNNLNIFSILLNILILFFQLIPWLLQGLDVPEPLRQSDVCVSAPTGSGKTLAFVIPIVQVQYIIFKLLF